MNRRRSVIIGQGDFMLMGYYKLFQLMKKVKITKRDLDAVQGAVDLYSLRPIADSLVGRDYAEFSDAVSANEGYKDLFMKAVRFMAAARKYYTPDDPTPDDFLKLFRHSTKNNVSLHDLEAVCKSIREPASVGDVLEHLIEFKVAHSEMWQELLRQNREDFTVGFWKDVNHENHVDLCGCNHFLIHSVDSLDGSYYSSFLDGVPVSCSVFDVKDPWWYRYYSRRIALVYDLGECKLLGASSRDCSTVFHKRLEQVCMEHLLCELAMPALWDFDIKSRFRPYVRKEELIEQVNKHDSNDVGEVLVFGKPCAVIVREPERLRGWPDEIMTFSKFFQLPVYLSECRKLTL